MVVWKNKRSWVIAKDIASYLSMLSKGDKSALRTWAGNARLRIGGKTLLEELKVLDL